MTHAIDFVDNLLAEMETIRQSSNQIASDEQRQSRLFSDEIIKHWLNFAVYYERSAVSFIGGWLAKVNNDEALHHFAHQVEDECNHFRWLNQHLKTYGGDYHQFKAPKEWSFLMETYYPQMEDLIEQLSAHNLAAETGVLGFMTYAFDCFPENLQKTLKTVIKDETYHCSFATKLLKKYCTTKTLQEKARRSALESMHYMQRAREVFVNI